MRDRAVWRAINFVRLLRWLSTTNPLRAVLMLLAAPVLEHPDVSDFLTSRSHCWPYTAILVALQLVYLPWGTFPPWGFWPLSRWIDGWCRVLLISLGVDFFRPARPRPVEPGPCRDAGPVSQ